MNLVRLTIAVILVWSSVAPPARAQEQTETTQKLGAEAHPQLTGHGLRKRLRQLESEFQRLFDTGKYEQAIPVLEEILRLAPQPIHLYDLGVTHFNYGNKEEAINAFQRFLAANPRDRGLVREAERLARILAIYIADIEEVRREAQARVTEAERTAKDARAAAQEAEQSRAQAAADAKAAHKAQSEAEAERDHMREILHSTPSGAGGGKRMLGASLALAGGLALGAGVFYGVEAMHAEEELERVEQWSTSHDWLVKRAEMYDRRTLLFSLAGAGMTAAGATLYYLGERDARQPISKGLELDIEPAFMPDGAGMRIQGRF